MGSATVPCHEITTFLQNTDILAVNFKVIWPLLVDFCRFKESPQITVSPVFYDWRNGRVRERMLSIRYTCNGEVIGSRKNCVIELFIYVLT
jgi:hypothetical protein